MSSFDETLREERLRKIIKSLNKVSEIDSRDIRKDARKSRSTSNKMKINYQRQIDKLLGQEEANNLPNVLKANKIFDKRSNKIESIKEKQIESQASLKRVNFQYRKLKLKKEKIARKHNLSHSRYQSSSKLEKIVIDPDQIKNNQISEIFEKGALKSPTYQEQIQQAIMKRLQATVKSSRKYIQTAYQDPQKIHSINATNKKDNLQLSDVIPNQFTFLTEQSYSVEKLPEPSFTKTQSIIINPHTNKTKRKSLIDLIRMSSSRQKSRGERIDERMTLKETQQYKSVQQTIQTLRKHIQQDNKLKESVVFSGLKKILYGDRKGRFIQDNAFKTRLKGECSDHYMNILKQQQQILKSFNGGYFNRRNLAQKFADILGKINRIERPFREDLLE